uniref:Cyclin-like domain-containing protein n=1 Tax=Panagrolaimus sp. JU765 TaxID=591449 RepID=A0AC34R2Z9_9BILA
MAGNFWKSSHFEQWILDKQDLLRERASDLKTLSEDEYQQVMIYFVNYIHILVHEAHVVNAPRQQMAATASLYFRRFYARRSLKDIDPFLVAHTCLFLSTRVEELGPISTSKFFAGIALTSKTRPWFPVIAEADIKNHMRLINEVEFYLLEVMDCCLIVYHPHRTLTKIIQDMTKDQQREKEVISDSWKIANDALRSDVCLLYPPHQIAVAALITAVVMNNRQEAFLNLFQETSTDYDAISDISSQIIASYKLHAQVIDIEENVPRLKALFGKIPKPSAVMMQPMMPSMNPMMASSQRM